MVTKEAGEKQVHELSSGLDKLKRSYTQFLQGRESDIKDWKELVVDVTQRADNVEYEKDRAKARLQTVHGRQMMYQREVSSVQREFTELGAKIFEDC